MSAIFGILHLDKAFADGKYLREMQKTLTHYGTDAQDIQLHQKIGLGCCLNKIGKYSKMDDPVYYDRLHEIVLVGDAIIYNRNELINTCLLTDNQQITTQALLLEAYIKWGKNCPKYLNGDFAFAIWDKQKEQLHIFRDHSGVRPFYYFFNQTTFAFATDYRALLALPFIGKELDEIMLYAYLSDTYHIDTESTYFKHIKRLPQAHVMCISERGISKFKYWTPGSGQKLLYKTEEEYSNELYSIVNDALKIRINNIDGKIASEFSGGLDSSVLTVLANRELKNEGKEIKAYSWSPSYDLLEKLATDERETMNRLCEQEGFECRFRNTSLSPEQEIASQAALTDGQRSEVLRLVLQEMSLQGIGFVISGWGGDEGISHRADILELLIAGDIGNFLKEAYNLSKGSPLRFIKLMLSLPIVFLFRPFSYFGTQNRGIPGILKKEFENRGKKHCRKSILKFKVNPMKHMESGVLVNRTELTAWLGADYQLQYLFPFLDHRVIDFAIAIPRHLFYKRGISRYIFRKAFEPILPYDLCYNKSKFDPAREVYIKKMDDLQKKVEVVLGLIDKEMFASYLDWDQLENLVRSKYFQQASRGSIFTLFKMQACYDIQRILTQEDSCLNDN